jgi:hypothetical protein
MNSAVVALWFEECAGAVRMSGRDRRTPSLTRQESSAKPQRLNALAFLRIEGNRPACAAARAGLAAPVRGVKAETHGHQGSNIVMPITGM